MTELIQAGVSALAVAEPEVPQEKNPAASPLPGIPLWLDLVKTTLGDLGMALPVGVALADGTVAHDFDVNDYTFAVEQQLATIRESGKGLSAGSFATEVLALMLKRVGGVYFEKLTMDERKLFLASLYSADALYAYAVIRRVTMGSNVVMNMTCPSCKSEFEFDADIDSLDVLVPEVQDGPMKWYVPLRDGFTITTKGGPVKVEAVIGAPMRWYAMLQIGKSGGPAERKREAFRQLIIDTVPSVRAGDAPLLIRDDDLARVSKYDYEVITAAMEDNSPGPQLIISQPCRMAGCGYEIVVPLDWSFESFFRFSRRQRERKKR